MSLSKLLRKIVLRLVGVVEDPLLDAPKELLDGVPVDSWLVTFLCVGIIGITCGRVEQFLGKYIVCLGTVSIR